MLGLFRRLSSFGQASTGLPRPTPRVPLQVEELEVRCTPAVLTVTNTSDTGVSGDGSLRGEIAAAAQSGDTIVFASNVTGTIGLNHGQLVISKGLTIQGPGANVLAISGNGRSRVLELFGGKTDTLSGLTINGGKTSYGAGIYNGNTLTILGCTISGNTSTGSGGGIYSFGSLTVRDSTISGNTAGGDGAGIFSAAPMVLQNSTVSGNTASVSGGGITLYRSATIQSSTVSGNTATSKGGGIYINGTATVQNTIVAGNNASTPNDITRNVGTLNADHSLLQNLPAGTINGTNNANLTGIGAMLGPLQNNGGPTQTMALLPGSPAIDAGDNNLVPYTEVNDQRGGAFDRIVGSAVDLGAFEEQTGKLVTRMYQDLLNRLPEAAGFAAWQRALAAGMTPEQVALGIYQSDEHRGLEVDQLFQQILGHDPDPQTRTDWIGALESGRSEADIAVALFTSPEFTSNFPTSDVFVNTLYQIVLGRDANVGEGNPWVQGLQNGTLDQAQVVRDFLASSEAHSEAISDDYNEFLNRAPDPVGLSVYTNAIENGHAGPDVLAAMILGSDEFTALPGGFYPEGPPDIASLAFLPGLAASRGV